MALVRPVTNGTISASSAQRLANVPSAVASGLVWPRPVSGDVLFFQVVKTAQSRGRTERTLRSAPIAKLVVSAFLPKLLLSPLFYQDGQIFVFPRPPKLLRLAEAWTKVSHCIDAIRKDLFAFTQKKDLGDGTFRMETKPGSGYCRRASWGTRDPLRAVVSVLPAAPA
jgi:hypothetical protein